MLARSLEIRERTLGPDSADTVASANKLGAVFARQGKYAQAEPLFRQALDVRRRVLGAEHPDTLVSLSNMAKLLSIQGNIDQAIVYAREALDIRRRTLGDDSPDTLDSLNNLGSLVARWNEVEAESYVREAVTRSRRVQGQDHPRTLAFLRHHADRLYSLKKYDEAERVLREVLDAQGRVLGSHHPDRLSTKVYLGEVLIKQGKLSEAEAELDEVLQQQQRLSPLTFARALRQLGMLRIGQKRYEEAEQLGRQSLTIQTGDVVKFASMKLVGQSLLSQSKFEAAEPFLIDNYSWNVRTKNRSGELETLGLIIDLYEQWQRPDKAAEWRAKLPK